MHRCARKQYADKLLRYRLQTRARACVYVYAYVYAYTYTRAPAQAYLSTPAAADIVVAMFCCLAGVDSLACLVRARAQGT